MVWFYAISSHHRPLTIMLIVKGCSPWRHSVLLTFCTELLPVSMTRETSPAACRAESPWLWVNPHALEYYTEYIAVQQEQGGRSLDRESPSFPYWMRIMCVR